MKRWYLFNISIVIMLSIVIAKPIYGINSMFFSASARVIDPDSNGVSTIPTSMTVQIVTNSGGPYRKNVFGTTDNDGNIYLSTSVNYNGTVLEYRVTVNISISSQPYCFYIPSSGSIEYVNYSARIYPTFMVGQDVDRNDVCDFFEMPLAQKFCPNLKLHSGDQGIRPVPVEIMDRNGDYILDASDIICDVYEMDGTGPYYATPSEITTIEGHNFADYFPLYWMRYSKACRINNGAMSNKIIDPHFEWGNNEDTDQWSWYGFWTNKMSSLSSRPDYYKYSLGTTYTHLFRSGSSVIIQYWFFYPFNAASNKHEGDWEHVNVIVDDQNPDNAQITKVVYYYHHKKISKLPSEILLINQTHPRVYVGGYNAVMGFNGNGSHGSFPNTGTWQHVGGFLNMVSETVDGLGLEINFNNYSNIVILPDFDFTFQQIVNSRPYIDSYGNDLTWVVFSSFWGNVVSTPSAGAAAYSWVIYFIDGYSFGIGNVTSSILSKWFNIPDDIGNVSPAGPAQHATWEEME